MKRVRCKCGVEHECAARLSNQERATKAARARLPRVTDGKIDVAGGAAHPEPQMERGGPLAVQATDSPQVEQTAGGNNKKAGPGAVVPQADVAPMAEQPTRNRQVAGSSPAVGSKRKGGLCEHGRDRKFCRIGTCAAPDTGEGE